MLVAFNVMAAAQSALAQAGRTEPQEIEATQKTPVVENRFSVSLDNPLLPYGVIGGLGGAALLLGAYAGRRRMKIAVPYVLACGTAVTLLLNPEIVTEKHEKISTEVIVAIDKSASQTSIRDRAATTTAMQAELMRVLDGLGNLNIRIVEIDSAKGADGTELFSAFNGLSDLNPQHVGAVIALTDGQIKDIPLASPFAKRAPIHGLISGVEGEKDRVARIELSPRFGLVGEEQTLRVIVEDLGAGVTLGKPVTLTIKGEGDDARTIEAITGQPVEIKVKVGHVGPNIVSIEAEGLEGELTPANNRIVASIQGIQEAVNVLLVSGTINASGVPLRDMFKSDADSNLVHVSIMRLPADFDDTPSDQLALTPFPLKTVGDSLNKFDMIVFDHYPNMNIIPPRYLAGIASHVKDGGAVLVLSGSEFAGRQSLVKSALGEILPVRPTGNILESEAAPRASALGQRHPVLRGLPGMNARADQEPSWGPWVHAVEATRHAGVSVLETPGGNPLLVLDRVGKGRVAVLLSDSLTLWKMGYQGGGPYTDLLRRVSHWLMKNPHLEEESLRLQALESGKKIMVERRTMAEAVDPITIVAPDGETRTIELTLKEPGVWVAEITTGKSGIYQARQEGSQMLVAYTHLGPENEREMEQVISTKEILEPLSALTGGTISRMLDAQGKIVLPNVQFLTEDAEKADAGRIGIREVKETILRGLDKDALIPGWLGALLIAGLAAYGWTREGDPKRVRAMMDKVLGRTKPDGPEARI